MFLGIFRKRFNSHCLEHSISLVRVHFSLPPSLRLPCSLPLPAPPQLSVSLMSVTPVPPRRLFPYPYTACVIVYAAPSFTLLHFYFRVLL